VRLGEVTLALQAEVCDRGKVNRGAPNGKNSRPAARIRERLDDFVVHEIPAYLPAGSGEHLYVRVEKRRLTTPEAVRALSEALGLDARAAGHAGMKDKHAVTTQWLSFHVAPSGRADALARASGLLVEKAGGSVRVLEASWHANKLKPGHLAGNRFALVLRGLSAEEEVFVTEALHEAGRGVPNYFGYQRFGVPSTAADGAPTPAERALAFVRGEHRGPRDPHARRFAMSTAQSVLFDRVLSARHQAGTWRSVLPGDLAKRGDSGGLFRVPLEGDELADAVARGERGEVLPTGPMFGAKMTWPDGAPAELEREVLREAGVTPEHLAAAASLGEGTRRPLWMPVRDLHVEPGGPPSTQVGPSGEARRALPPAPADVTSAIADEAPCERAGLAVSFTLPKGGYATTVLEAVCEVIDAARGPNRASPDVLAPEAE
jgi:tRNA pseudouridine13 synthase